MADLDALAPDQRAVLQLVLGQGRDFDQLASLLKISPHAVRDRATVGTETLVPPPPNVNASERDAIVAYLLGAGSRPRDLSEEGRGWGEEVREALAPLAREELPDLPGGPAAPPAPAPKPAPRAAAVPAPAPAAADADEEDEGADQEPIEPRSLARPPAERRSLLGGALLLAGVVVVVAVILIKVLGGSDDNKNPKPAAATTPPTANTSSAATQTAQGNATTTGASGVKVRAQVNLAAPGGGTKTAGIAQLVTQNTSAGFAVTAQGLTTVAKTYTGVWLTGSGVKPVLIAAVTNDQVKKGRFTGLTRAPAKLKSYTQMELTRETITNSKKAPTGPSSSVIIRGALKVPADFTS